MARRTLEETRELILEAGAGLLAETGFTISTGELSLIDACRRAGLSTAGSGYKIWPTQQEFRVDVLRHALSVGNDEMLDFEELASPGPDGEMPSLVELIRRVGQASADQTIGTDAFAQFMAVTSAARSDPELQQLVDHDHDVTAKRMVAMYDALLVFYELEMVPPYDVTALMAALEALVNGFAMHPGWLANHGYDRIERLTGPDGETQPWHLLACASQAIVEGFTRPRQRSR